MRVVGATGLQDAAGVLIAAGAYFLGTGLTGFAPLVWFAPIPVLIRALDSSSRLGASMAFLAYVLGASISPRT